MRIKFYKNKTRARSIFNWNKSFKKNFFLKLKNKSNLIGTCYLKDGFIYSLVINPKYRNKGYGKLLLKAAEIRLRKLNYKMVKLIPQDNDDSLREFYSKQGYIGLDKHPDYEEENKEWWIMYKKL